MGSENTASSTRKKNKFRKQLHEKDEPEDSLAVNTAISEKSENETKMHTKKKRKKRKSVDNNTPSNNKVAKKDEDESQNDSLKKTESESETYDDTARNDKTKNKEVTSKDKESSKKPSNRQIKREKAIQREALKRDASRLLAMQKALNYISKWKHARNEWKFEKLRQVWLINNLLDEVLVPDTVFPTILEYFDGCKGMALQQLLKKGMDVIKKVEEDEENKEELMESTEYKRARQLLQALPTET